MIREVKFESQDRRIKQILAALTKTLLKLLKQSVSVCSHSVSRVQLLMTVK